MEHFDLKKIRKATGKSQQKIADQAGISRQYYNYIERGVRCPPVKTAQKIASVLSFQWTLFYDNKEKKGKDVEHEQSASIQ